jgi:SAM-dependent methyltransferase
VQRLFEPACGTGRLLFRLALAGYQVSGLDLNAKAVEYCNARLARFGLPAAVRVGDMTNFRLPHKVDACFNMINSFRHLMSEEAAKSHLMSVAKCLVRGGLYVFGLHLSPTAIAPVTDEAWSARRGHLQVNTRLRAVQRNPRRREERFVMVCDVYTPCRSLHLEEQLVFRSYTAPQLQKLLSQVPQLETVAAYDFSYQLRRPIEVSAATEDVVYVLQKR